MLLNPTAKLTWHLALSSHTSQIPRRRWSRYRSPDVPGGLLSRFHTRQGIFLHIPDHLLRPPTDDGVQIVIHIPSTL